MIFIALIVGFLAGIFCTYIAQQRFIEYLIKTNGTFLLGERVYRGMYLYSKTDKCEVPEAILEATQKNKDERK